MKSELQKMPDGDLYEALDEQLTASENFFMNFNCVVPDCVRVTIGDNVQIGPSVQLYTAYHPLIAAEHIKGPGAGWRDRCLGLLIINQLLK